MSKLLRFICRISLILVLTVVVLSQSTMVLGSALDTTIITTSVSEIEVIADKDVSAVGFTVNGKPYNGPVYAVSGQDVVVSLNQHHDGRELQTDLVGNAVEHLTSNSVTLTDISSMHLVLYLSLSEITESFHPGKPSVPSIPEIPDVPDTPSEPENPDTPGSDEPGSDEPYRPILPPAGIVYNIAGFASLIAGFLLLFLLLFMRGNLVYRTLKKHAKEHGEKPDKEEKKHLKEIASAVVSRIKDDEKYPEWKKNSDVMKHLGVDICLLLDEMKYREAVPREALVIEILEKARGKINRHRL